MEVPDSRQGPASGISVYPPRRTFQLHAGPHVIPLGARTLVMGVLNCTPDSFSDGGRHLSPEDAVRRLEAMEEEGADWIDVGGESTRPGAEPVPAEEEWRRIAPVLQEARRRGCRLPISVDTTKGEVAHRALEEGASILNDVSGLRFDLRLAELAARFGAGLVLMHMLGDPRTMQADPTYEDVVRDVRDYLYSAAQKASDCGVAAEQILVDPGIGFGKTVEHNLELIRRLPEIASTGYPVLVGASRKSFLGRLLDLPAHDRLEGSLSAHVAAALAGAHVIRAHDVRATVRALRIADALRAGAVSPGPPVPSTP